MSTGPDALSGVLHVAFYCQAVLYTGWNGRWPWVLDPEAPLFGGHGGKQVRAKSGLTLRPTGTLCRIVLRLTCQLEPLIYRGPFIVFIDVVRLPHVHRRRKMLCERSLSLYKIFIFGKMLRRNTIKKYEY